MKTLTLVLTLLTLSHSVQAQSTSDQFLLERLLPDCMSADVEITQDGAVGQFVPKFQSQKSYGYEVFKVNYESAGYTIPQSGDFFNYRGYRARVGRGDAHVGVQPIDVFYLYIERPGLRTHVVTCFERDAMQKYVDFLISQSGGIYRNRTFQKFLQTLRNKFPKARMDRFHTGTLSHGDPVYRRYILSGRSDNMFIAGCYTPENASAFEWFDSHYSDFPRDFEERKQAIKGQLQSNKPWDENLSTERFGSEQDLPPMNIFLLQLSAPDMSMRIDLSSIDQFKKALDFPIWIADVASLGYTNVRAYGFPHMYNINYQKLDARKAILDMITVQGWKNSSFLDEKQLSKAVPFKSARLNGLLLDEGAYRTLFWQQKGFDAWYLLYCSHKVFEETLAKLRIY